MITAPEDSELNPKGADVLVVSNGTTLTGYVELAGGAGFQAGDRPVFTFQLLGTNDETWTFTLQDQLDHAAPPAGTAVENTLAIDFSSFVTARDFDFDTITLDATGRGDGDRRHSDQSERDRFDGYG